MEVNTFVVEDYQIIKIVGDCDASSSLEVDNALEKSVSEGCKKIFVDCSELDYISSPGIGVFTSRIDDCEKAGISIILFAVSDQIINVFQILGLDQFIPIVKSLDEAKSLAYGT